MVCSWGNRKIEDYNCDEKPFPIKCVLEKSCIDSGDQKFLRH